MYTTWHTCKWPETSAGFNWEDSIWKKFNFLPFLCPKFLHIISRISHKRQMLLLLQFDVKALIQTSKYLYARNPASYS